MVAAFYPVSGAESTWDARGGNSKAAVRGVELMMECNDCLYEGWNEQTKTTHCERWADKLEVETHIVRIGHIQDKPEGDKCWETLGSVTTAIAQHHIFRDHQAVFLLNSRNS